MKRRDAGIDQGRRAFLINGALVVGFAMVPGAGRAFADTEVDTLGTQVLAPDLPGSLRTNPSLPFIPARSSWAPGSRQRCCKSPPSALRSRRI
jgi:hypothetical protein